MTVWTKQMLLGFEKPHYVPEVRSSQYLPFCEAFAERIGTTKEDVADQVDMAIDAEGIPEEKRTPDQQANYLAAVEVGFIKVS